MSTPSAKNINVNTDLFVPAANVAARGFSLGYSINAYANLINALGFICFLGIGGSCALGFWRLSKLQSSKQTSDEKKNI